MSDVAIPRFSIYRRAFEERGYKHVYQSVPDGTPPVAKDRQAGVLVASKYEAVASLKPSPALAIPWPERLLSVTLYTPWGEVDLYNAYVLWTYLKGDAHVPTRLATLEAQYTVAHMPPTGTASFAAT